MSKIKAVLFDLDGVLVDAREWHYEALNQALALFGHQISREDHLTMFDGLPTSKKMEHLIEQRNFPEGIAVLVNQLKQLYTKQLIAVHCYPIFHIEYAVSRLQQDGYKLAVCTNSIRETLDLMLSRSALTHYFDLTLSNEDVGDKPKPDPTVYRMAMETLGVRPDECVIVEDNEYGVQAAIKSGGNVLRVADPDEVRFEAIQAFIAKQEGAV